MTEFARYPSLRDGTVLITGGATGIGASLVEQFASQDAKVGSSTSTHPQGRHWRRHSMPLCQAPLFLRADLTDTTALRSAIDAVRRHFGPVTVFDQQRRERSKSVERHPMGLESTTHWMQLRSGLPGSPL